MTKEFAILSMSDLPEQVLAQLKDLINKLDLGYDFILINYKIETISKEELKRWVEQLK